MESEGTRNIKGKIVRSGLAGIVIGGMATACAKPTEAVEPKGETKSPMTETMPTNPVKTESPFVEVTPEKATEELPDSVDLGAESNEMFMGVDLTELAENSPEMLYTVVDKEHPVSKEYVEKEIVPSLVKLKDLEFMENKDGFPTLIMETEVNGLMKEDVLTLVNEAWKEGAEVYVKGGFRSFDQQQFALDNVWRDTTKVSLPGQSQHQTGLAIDFSTPENNQAIGLNSGFGETEAGVWLMENAWKYGFVNSFINGHDGVRPAAEQHHYLYVGKEIALAYKKLLDQEWNGDIFDLQGMIARAGK